MKKQTAVEWLINELGEYFPHQIGGIHLMIEQAKEMERQQIIDAYDEGQQNPYEYSEDNDVNWYDGKKYYKETFKS